MSSSSSSWPEMKLPESIATLLEKSKDKKEEGGDTTTISTNSISSNSDDDEDDITTSLLPPCVTGVMNFVTKETFEPYTKRDASGSDGKLEGLEWNSVEVKIHNGRRRPSLNLKKNGFELVRKSTSCDIDFYDQRDIVQRYYPHCEELLREHLKNEKDEKDKEHNSKEKKNGDNEKIRVYAFDHNVRSNAIERKKLQNNEKTEAVVQNPVGVVHADYTIDSAPRRLRQLTLPPKTNDVHRQFLEEGQPLLDPHLVEDVLVHKKRRFAMVNIWRNIDKQNPVLQRPLACMDASSATTNDNNNNKDDDNCLRKFSIYYPDRVGENYFCVHDEAQKWYYFPKMTHDEAILLKQWDSHGNEDISTFSIHSAFLDPTTQSNSNDDDDMDSLPPRQSIEVRLIVIYPEE